LEEVLAQLDEKVELLDNSVGIVMCNPEFIHSGTLRHLCEGLPFEVAGVTSSSQAVNDEAGELIFTVFVMTADDVRFKTGVTEGLSEETAGPIQSALRAAVADEAELPKLALIFPSRNIKYAGDAYAHELEQVIPGVPTFGAIAVDDTLAFEFNETIHNSESYKTEMSFILCYGNINPRFVVGTLPKHKAMPYKGEVTSSDGPYVREINNINAYTYFEDIGLAVDGKLDDNYILVPFVIDLKARKDYDGFPILRAHASFTDEGTALFRGNVDEGSTFTLLACDSDDVLSVTRQKMEEACEVPGVNGLLVISCIARRMMTIRLNPLLELEAAKGAVPPDIPFMMGYAAGEICPTSVRDGIPANRFHNYSLVILVV